MPNLAQCALTTSLLPAKVPIRMHISGLQSNHHLHHNNAVEENFDFHLVVVEPWGCMNGFIDALHYISQELQKKLNVWARTFE